MSSVTFTFSQPNAKIFDCTITDSTGRAPFAISTKTYYNAFTYQYEREKTMFKTFGGEVIASVDWEHSSPRVRFGSGGEKVKVKEWLVYDRAARTRTFTYGGRSYVVRCQDHTTVHFTSASHPSHSIAAWYRPHNKHEHSYLEVTSEALSIRGLLETLLLVTFLLACGESLGDHHEHGFFKEAVTDGVGESIGEALVGGLFGGH